MYHEDEDGSNHEKAMSGPRQEPKQVNAQTVKRKTTGGRILDAPCVLSLRDTKPIREETTLPSIAEPREWGGC